MPTSFFPVTISKAAQQVVEQITFAIRSGVVSTGDRLPHIDELSSTMKVSKPVIGDALKLLSSAGIVETIRGVGGGVVVVRDEIPVRLISKSWYWDRFSLIELLEARRPIEVRVAVLAARNASKEDFQDIERQIMLLDKYRKARPARRIHHDHLFHYAIGRAAHSKALAQFQHEIMEQLYTRFRDYFDQYEDVDQVLALHEETFKALESKDEKQILEAMDRHLQPLERAVMSEKP
ncbi:MAG: GntR family transcriptional regulator [Chloroflexi bacterium]|nr:GntR family transcriptional regulator [Chloroflexota bacterium]|tara:strand:+ start:486 stop:1190 length:705 start_codon:yes stop_codon:yes gene_type:complete